MVVGKKTVVFTLVHTDYWTTVKSSTGYERLDLYIEPNSCLSDLSDSLKSLNSMKVLHHLGKTPLWTLLGDARISGWGFWIISWIICHFVDGWRLFILSAHIDSTPNIFLWKNQARFLQATKIGKIYIRGFQQPKSYSSWFDPTNQSWFDIPEVVGSNPIPGTFLLLELLSLWKAFDANFVQFMINSNN